MPPGPAFKNKPASGSPVHFKSDGTDLVFARVAAMVRGSSELHGCTVHAWDDASVDQTPPSGEGPPWISLTPSPGMAKIHCRSPQGIVHRTPLVVTVESSIYGTNVVQSQRLWGAIGRAIYPSPQMDAQLQSLGVSKIAIEQPVWAAPKGGSNRCEAVGSFVMELHTLTTE